MSIRGISSRREAAALWRSAALRGLLGALAWGSIIPCAIADPAPVPQSSWPAGDVLQAPARNRGGIWKAAVPPVQMRGEFDDFDPLGVAAGARIKADCSLNWRDPDDGKMYCFSSGTSLEMFLDAPHTSIERAREGWRRLNAGG